MTFSNPLGRLSACVALAGTLMFASVASAQEISDSHMAAAKGTISALGATEEFDNILPGAASALQVELVQKNPNLEAEITELVQEKAIELAARRAQLEQEAARAYAIAFTEEELNAISAFYLSETGQKLISEGALVTRQLIEAAKIWQTGISRDLAVAVATELDVVVREQANPAAATVGETTTE